MNVHPTIASLTCLRQKDQDFETKAGLQNVSLKKTQSGCWSDFAHLETIIPGNSYFTMTVSLLPVRKQWLLSLTALLLLGNGNAL